MSPPSEGRGAERAAGIAAGLLETGEVALATLRGRGADAAAELPDAFAGWTDLVAALVHASVAAGIHPCPPGRCPGEQADHSISHARSESLLVRAPSWRVRIEAARLQLWTALGELATAQPGLAGSFYRLLDGGGYSALRQGASTLRPTVVAIEQHVRLVLEGSAMRGRHPLESQVGDALAAASDPAELVEHWRRGCKEEVPDDALLALLTRFRYELARIRFAEACRQLACAMAGRDPPAAMVLGALDAELVRPDLVGEADERGEVP